MDNRITQQVESDRTAIDAALRNIFSDPPWRYVSQRHRYAEIKGLRVGLPSGTLIAVALNAVLSAADGAPRIEASNVAVVHEDSAPATDIGGGVSVRPVRSLFQSDTIALRMTWGLSWALRDPRAVAWIQGP